MTGRFVALLAILLLPPLAAAGRDFNPLPDRAYALLVEAIRLNAAGDRVGAGARLRETIDQVGEESGRATSAGRQELADMRRDLGRAVVRIEGGLSVPTADLVDLASLELEGLAYHYTRRAELLKQQGLPGESAASLRLAALSSAHARRFRQKNPGRVDQTAARAFGDLGRNAAGGIGRVFRDIGDGVGRVTGLDRLDERKKPRPKGDPDPWN